MGHCIICYILENSDIEVVLYVPRNHDEQDPNSQAMFRRDEYYSVGRKIIPNHYAGCVRAKVVIT